MTAGFFNGGKWAQMRRWMTLPLIIVLVLAILLGSGKTLADRRTANQQLAQELVEHQSYADTDPANYGYAKYIRQIIDRGHGKITVQVTRNFCRLSDNDKTNVMNQVQALARMVLTENRRISKQQAARGLEATICCQKKVIGHSRGDDHYRYRW